VNTNFDIHFFFLTVHAFINVQNSSLYTCCQNGMHRINSLTLHPIHPQEKSPQYPLNSKLELINFEFHTKMFLWFETMVREEISWTLHYHPCLHNQNDHNRNILSHFLQCIFTDSGLHCPYAAPHITHLQNTYFFSNFGNQWPASLCTMT